DGNNSTTSSPVTVTVTNTVSTQGLVASYNFNAGTGTTLADRSGTGNNGTIANGTWSVSGHTLGALSFNGSTSMVTVNDSNSLDLTTGMTLEAWVNPSALGANAWRTVLFKEQTGNMVYSLYAHQGAFPLAQVFIAGDERNATGTSSLTTNTWAHLA